MRQETQRMLQKPDPGISATPHENNLRYFNVVIAGPQDSAYDGAPVMMKKDLLQLHQRLVPLFVFRYQLNFF